jgi:two-component system, OmpR family, heavy metal sensor histidine kinase CusS
MLSKPAEPRSITSQLVFLFTPAAALLLTCGLAVFYWIVVQHSFEEDNEFLTDKVLALWSDLNKGEGPQSLKEELQTIRPGEHAYWVRVVDSGGRTVAETPGMDRLLPPDVFPAATKPGPIRSPKNFRSGGKLFSLVAITNEGGGQSYQLQVAQDRSGDEEFTREFGILLGIVLVFGALASALIGISVTKRGLRPLSEMARSLQRVEPTHLQERVPPSEWPRELQPVAIAFDEMMDRLEDSFTRLSQFSADLAHELRTPIANIRGEAEVALTRPRTSDEYREVIESVAGECERLSGIIESLLFLARAEGADRHIQPVLFSGRPAIEKIAAYYAAIAEEHDVMITCIGEAEIYADPLLFGRAVSNLVDNALRFTSTRGSISISLLGGTAQSEVSIKDTGCGIQPEQIPRVFDRFYRADPSRSSEGTGLGLALVKSITDLHRGSAIVKSEVNKGTTVTLIFPNKTNSQELVA